MKKTIIIILLIILFIPTTKDKFIRIRVLANSNNTHDQKIKEKISNNISNEMYLLLKDETNIENARKIIKNNISLVDNIIKTNLKEEDYSYKINYGYNYFPEKKYNNKTFKEGNYESLLVTLGNGLGDNWWCILFPPLCLIDAKESEEVEYDFLLKEIFNTLFTK